MAFAEEMNTFGNAYLIRGGKEMIADVLEALGRAGVETKGNPDIFIREYLQFGIEEARELRLRACLRAFSHRQASSRAVKETHRIFIIVSSGMTSEAQNALLKTLEEPQAGAAFYFIVSSPETLLPTLRSRVQILSFSRDGGQEELINANDFLRSDRQKRIEMLKKLLPKEGEVRDVGAIITFLSSIERTLGAGGAVKTKEGLEAVYRARKYVADKGSILRSLLEQVALLVPER